MTQGSATVMSKPSRFSTDLNTPTLKRQRKSAGPAGIGVHTPAERVVERFALAGDGAAPVRFVEPLPLPPAFNVRALVLAAGLGLSSSFLKRNFAAIIEPTTATAAPATDRIGTRPFPLFAVERAAGFFVPMVAPRSRTRIIHSQLSDSGSPGAQLGCGGPVRAANGNLYSVTLPALKPLRQQRGGGGRKACLVFHLHLYLQSPMHLYSLLPLDDVSAAKSFHYNGAC